MRRRRTRRSVKQKQNSVARFLRGSATITLILILIIIGSILLVGGIFPKFPVSQNLQDRPPGPEAVIDETTLTPSAGQFNLQLKTIGFKECAETITMDFLLDRTGSMGNDTPSGVEKIDRLKEAVLTLTNNLSDNSVIGIQSFSSRSITNDVPIAFYRDNKSQIAPAINSLDASGSTPTHDALAFSYQLLVSAVPQYPDRQFNFVLISDGQPQPATQDPRLFNPNPADQIKALGVNVYTLAIYSESQAGNPDLANLLKDISSDPVNNYFQANTADDTTRLLTIITERICESQAKQE